MYKKLNYFINILRESFIELLPYMVLISILIISIQLITIFNLDLLSLQNKIVVIVQTVSKFLPILLIVIISINISKKYNFNISIGVTTSLLVYVLYNLLNDNYKFELDGLLTMYSLIIPFIALKFLNVMVGLNLFKYDVIINLILKDIFKLIFPFFIVIFVTSISLYYINQSLEEYIFGIGNYIETLPSHIFLFLYGMFSQLFWFVGIHGVTAAALFFDHSILQNSLLPNISNDNFMNLFTIFGGSGTGLALLLAILINGKNKYWTKVSKLSLPFVLFNINEILIYGLPIVFNKYLFIPFVCVPMINFILAYNIISLNIVEFTVIDVHWAIPTFINAYLATNGSVEAILLQLFLLCISILIYYPFVSRYAKVQNEDIHNKKLKEALNLTNDIYSDSMIGDKQIALVNKNIKIQNVIKLINSNELVLYYQAKINIKQNICNNFEALIRMKKSNVVLNSSSFLKSLEEDIYMVNIDYWVAKELKKQFNIWNREDFYPTISMNLHPITLRDDNIILKISKMFIDDNIKFEIIEKALLNNDAKKNVLFLSKNYDIIVDDFGSGYSNLLSIYENPISMLKLDKSLIDKIAEDKMFKICNYISNLCEDLKIDVIAEGVETKLQVEIIRKTKIKYIQGYIYTRAIKANMLKEFSKNVKSNI